MLIYDGLSRKLAHRLLSCIGKNSHQLWLIYAFLFSRQKPALDRDGKTDRSLEGQMIGQEAYCSISGWLYSKTVNCGRAQKLRSI